MRLQTSAKCLQYFTIDLNHFKQYNVPLVGWLSETDWSVLRAGSLKLLRTYCQVVQVDDCLTKPAVDQV